MTDEAFLDWIKNEANIKRQSAHEAVAIAEYAQSIRMGLERLASEIEKHNNATKLNTCVWKLGHALGNALYSPSCSGASDLPSAYAKGFNFCPYCSLPICFVFSK